MCVLCTTLTYMLPCISPQLTNSWVGHLLFTWMNCTTVPLSLCCALLEQVIPQTISTRITGSVWGMKLYLTLKTHQCPCVYLHTHVIRFLYACALCWKNLQLPHQVEVLIGHRYWCKTSIYWEGSSVLFHSCTFRTKHLKFVINMRYIIPVVKNSFQIFCLSNSMSNVYIRF